MLTENEREIVKTCYNHECRGNKDICVLSGDECNLLLDECEASCPKYYQCNKVAATNDRLKELEMLENIKNNEDQQMNLTPVCPYCESEDIDQYNADGNYNIDTFFFKCNDCSRKFSYTFRMTLTNIDGED